MTAIAWLRRDLRLHDHAVLATACNGEGPVQPVFIFDTEVLTHFPAKNDRRLSFLAATLCHMDAELKKRGGGMLVLHGAASKVMPKLATALKADHVICAEDFEPAAIARDAAVKQALPNGSRFVQVLDQLLVHPKNMRKADGTAYKVFTPFYQKTWRPQVGPETVAEFTVNDKGRYADVAHSRTAARDAGLEVLELHHGPAHLLKAVGYEYAEDPIWTVDDVATRLARFIEQRLSGYPTARNLVSKPGTSQLSPYLRFGLVSIRQVTRAAMEDGHGEKWISELGWREFYVSVLAHYPEVVSQEFAKQYRGGVIPWRDNAAQLKAFCEGRTGYPIVDAAVRELLTTGWMHNRARMIVASFFTKHLLMDWRIGEAFFAQYLMDYDLASNNGGWQWSASTGTDAQPYFRVFNPTLQGEKFDPEGDYVRGYVPELRDVPTKHIHTPWLSLLKPKDYPAPIVDHAEARQRAIAAFKKAA